MSKASNKLRKKVATLEAKILKMKRERPMHSPVLGERYIVSISGCAGNSQYRFNGVFLKEVYMPTRGLFELKFEVVNESHLF